MLGAPCDGSPCSGSISGGSPCGGLPMVGNVPNPVQRKGANLINFDHEFQAIRVGWEGRCRVLSLALDQV